MHKHTGTAGLHQLWRKGERTPCWRACNVDTKANGRVPAAYVWSKHRPGGAHGPPGHIGVFTRRWPFGTPCQNMPSDGPPYHQLELNMFSSGTNSSRPVIRAGKASFPAAPNRPCWVVMRWQRKIMSPGPHTPGRRLCVCLYAHIEAEPGCYLNWPPRW